jgi:putative aldouronate transport system substrate-binding protein
MKSRTVKRTAGLMAALMVSASLFAGGGAQGASGAAGQKTEILWAVSQGYTGAVPQSDAPIVKAIEEKFNVTLKFFPTGHNDNVEQFNLMVSAGDIPDVWFSWGGAEFYKQGILKPVNEETIAKNMPYYYNNILLKLDPAKISLSKRKVPEGYYGVPGLTQHGATSFYRIYRQDWLDTVGLKVPTTLAELDAVLWTFTFNDPDRNGKNDTYGVNPQDGRGILFGDVFGAFGVMPSRWVVQNGKVIWGDITGGYKEALKYIARWYKDGVIYPEFLTQSEAQHQAPHVDGRAGSDYSNYR